MNSRFVLAPWLRFWKLLYLDSFTLYGGGGGDGGAAQRAAQQQAAAAAAAAEQQRQAQAAAAAAEAARQAEIARVQRVNAALPRAATMQNATVDNQGNIVFRAPANTTPAQKAQAMNAFINSGGTLSGAENSFLTNYNTYTTDKYSGNIADNIQFDPNTGLPTMSGRKQGETTAQYALRLQQFINHGGSISSADQALLNSYNQQQAAAAAPPYSRAQALFGQTYGIDPNAVQNPTAANYGGVTNPYYQQAINQLTAMQNAGPPSQYQQATDLLNQTAAKAGAMSNYTPQQIADIQAQASQMAMPSSWTEAGTAQKYMNPYINTALQSQLALQNQQFAQQLNQLKGQAAAQGAYGGSRSTIAEQVAQQQQNMLNQNLIAQGLNSAYNTGMGQFATEQGQALQAGQANLSAAQQTALANQQAALQAAIQNQQAGLSAQGLNLQANSQLGTAANALTNVGQNVAAYNSGLLQNWGAAGQTTQALGQQALNQVQQNAQNLWGGVSTAAAPAVATVAGQPWGGVNTSAQTSAPSYAFKAKGGVLSIRRKKK